MDFDPQKFFIGLMDFFTILLPGAFLTYLLMGMTGPIILGSERYHSLTGTKGVAAFLVASYLFGHLIFLLGAWLDEFYDWCRRYTLNTQIYLLARRGRLLPWPARVLLWLVFKRESNLAVDRAGKIKKESLKSLQAVDSINNFQWCKAFLNQESPQSFAVVQRFEADSKFFRCFVVVLLVLIGVYAWQGQKQLATIVAGLLPLALWRYMEQRHKATNHAYWSVITLTGHAAKITIKKASLKSDGPTHAGGIVFRKRWFREPRYLLVEAKKDPEQWVLPKGHIEEGEHPRETAVREVHEETGAWARIRADLGTISYSVDGEPVTVQVFLMKFAGYGFRGEKRRKHTWLTLDEAIKEASHIQISDLLEAAEQRRVQP